MAAGLPAAPARAQEGQDQQAAPEALEAVVDAAARMPAEKAQRHGMELERIGRWFPLIAICARCGHIQQRMPLDVRVRTCPSCSVAQERDEKVAANLLAAGAGVRRHGNLSPATRRTDPLHREGGWMEQAVEQAPAPMWTDARQATHMLEDVQACSSWPRWAGMPSASPRNRAAAATRYGATCAKVAGGRPGCAGSNNGWRSASHSTAATPTWCPGSCSASTALP